MMTIKVLMSNNLNIKMRWLTMSLLILKTHLLVQEEKKGGTDAKEEGRKTEESEKDEGIFIHIYASKSIIVSTRKRGIESRIYILRGICQQEVSAWWRKRRRWKLNNKFHVVYFLLSSESKYFSATRRRKFWIFRLFFDSAAPLSAAASADVKSPRGINSTLNELRAADAFEFIKKIIK